MTAAHSYWPASGMEQRMLCPGSHVLQQGAPDNANHYAAEGTAAHQLLTWVLQQEKNAADFMGKSIEIDDAGRVMPPGDLRQPTWTYLVDEDMVEHVQVMIDYVREIAGDNPIIVDTKVNYANYLGVPEDEAWGTLDVTVLLPDEIVSIDLKYGMGVEVSAGENRILESATGHGVIRNPNPQLALYGLGALNAYRDFGDFKRVRLVISQPRISKKPSEYDLSVAELEMWGETLARDAVAKCQRAEATIETVHDRRHWDDSYLKPGEKQCKFCKAKATCPALRREVAAVAFDADPATPDEFAEAATVLIDESIDTSAGNNNEAALWLSACLDKVDLIEDWCKAIRTEVERRLLAGEGIPNYKLVQGKKGNREFRSKEEAEIVMKSMRLKTEEMYTFTLISPTTAEKLAKAGMIGPRQWPRLAAMIVQREGKPHVAHVSDKRPALTITPVTDDFTDLTSSTDSDLAGDAFAWLR